MKPKFYGFNAADRCWTELPEAAPIEIHGERYVSHHEWNGDEDDWAVTDIDTGAIIAVGYTREKAILEARVRLKRLPGKIETARAEIKQTKGWLPCPYPNGAADNGR